MAKGFTIEGVHRKDSPGGKVWRPTYHLPSIQATYDGHIHLDRGAAEVGNSGASGSNVHTRR